ncbi:MAG: hypothetical protein LBI18_12955 [Planctomycetaceae bacterium]|nr:hypothetical protein [Planctomycetaceae bacterium]
MIFAFPNGKKERCQTMSNTNFQPNTKTNRQEYLSNWLAVTLWFEIRCAGNNSPKAKPDIVYPNEQINP